MTDLTGAPPLPSAADTPAPPTTRRIHESPLSSIERQVQDEAKRLALDLDQPDGERRLTELIDRAIEEWQADAARGVRASRLGRPDVVAQSTFDSIARYGPLTRLLDDDDVWEVIVNSPASIFVKRHSGPTGYHDESFVDDDHVTRTLTRLLDRASSTHRKLDPSEGLQDAQLDTGARLHIVHGELARGGHTMVNIRKFTGSGIHSLDELVERRMLTAQVARFLSVAVGCRQSIVFAGVPGSGKTTLLGRCAAQLDPTLRVVVAEEVFELDIALPNVASMQTRPARPDRPAVDLRRLVAGFLRMAPDIAIVGEVRDREALPLLLTLSSGVKGFTTIHAGSTRQALTRLRFICQLADSASQIPLSALNALVTEAIDLVVHVDRGPAGPRVMAVTAVEDLAGGAEAVQFTTTDLFLREGYDRELLPTGLAPIRLRNAFARAGHDLGPLLGHHP
jgi:pilus assembly protein CpaF